MLHVSTAALTLLKEALESERSEDDHVFRLEFSDDQFVLNLDAVQADDVQYEHDGSTVLAAPQDVAENLLSETTIDMESTDQGPTLVLVTSET
jgi:Fe-S cluster assembly iron-binding protein IscA